MEHVEPSVNKWKRKPDYTYASFGRVYGFIWGFFAGCILGVIMDNMFLYAVICAVSGIVGGGLIGGHFINYKKKAAAEKDQPILAEGETVEETGEKKIQL